MTYQKRLKQHLSEYKRTTLGISEPGIFRHKGRELLKEHILPIQYAWQNLLPDFEEPIRAHLDAKKVKRHQYFHHLNSSQAFAFNLFFPFFAGGEATAAPLLRAFGQAKRRCRGRSVGGELTRMHDVEWTWVDRDGVSPNNGRGRVDKHERR